VAQSTTILRETFNCHGFNVGMNLGRVAGAGVDQHIHMHIVPRWNGDNNFMPVLSDTKVINEAIEDTYKTLKPKFAKL
jgi:ATP adenylyltransferase